MHVVQREGNLMLRNNHLLTKFGICVLKVPKEKIIVTIYCLYYIFYQKRGVVCVYIDMK